MLNNTNYIINIYNFSVKKRLTFPSEPKTSETQKSESRRINCEENLLNETINNASQQNTTNNNATSIHAPYDVPRTQTNEYGAHLLPILAANPSENQLTPQHKRPPPAASTLSRRVNDPIHDSPPNAQTLECLAGVQTGDDVAKIVDVLKGPYLFN